MFSETVPETQLSPADPPEKQKARGGSWIRTLVYLILIGGLGFIVWRIHKNQQLTAQNSANQAAELASQPIPVRCV